MPPVSELGGDITGARRRDPVLSQDVQDAFFSEFLPGVRQNLTPSASLLIVYIYIVVWLDGFEGNLKYF